MGAGEVIGYSLIRSLIQDKPKYCSETIISDGVTKTFALENTPILYSDNYSATFTQGENELDEFSLDCDSGALTFSEPPESGVFEAKYYTAQITDIEIEEALSMALARHDPIATWEDFPPAYAPFVQWLAAASLFYTLAARWATKVRVKVETTEVHEHQVAGRYFELARKMEERYYEASAGIINVEEVTRRDAYTGLLVPLTEEFYLESE